MGALKTTGFGTDKLTPALLRITVKCFGIVPALFPMHESECHRRGRCAKHDRVATRGSVPGLCSPVPDSSRTPRLPLLSRSRSPSAVGSGLAIQVSHTLENEGRSLRRTPR